LRDNRREGRREGEGSDGGTGRKQECAVGGHEGGAESTWEGTRIDVSSFCLHVSLFSVGKGGNVVHAM
jgi:hypothetical protein